MEHVSVLLNEVVDGLALKKGDKVLDGTLGAGGHSIEIAKRLGRDVEIIGFDLDQSALDIAKKKFEALGANISTIHDNFRNMQSACEKAGINNVDKIMLDLGVSSMELGQSGRGFSFNYDEPLLMTLKNPIEEDDITARNVVNEMSERDLADIIYKYGEERFSRQISKAIVESRRKKKIETTKQLSEIIWNAVPAGYRKGKINPATKTFQALRIYVNDELGAVEDGIRNGWKILNPGGRIAVITFHSLEDRIVKNLFKELAKGEQDKNEKGILITKKPIVPTRAEVLANRRSRSAKLRIIEKI